MAIAETAKLMSSLDMNTTGFDKGIASATKSMGFFSHTVSTALGVGLAKVAGAGISALGGAISGGIESLGALEDATTAVDAAIAATGKTGDITSAQIADWANAIESNIHAAFDDKAITAAAATLIRFGNVTTTNLQPALVVMTDLAAKTGDIESAATLLAKVLADPAKAAGKLAKQGIVLDATQQAQLISLTTLNKEEQKHFAALAKVSKAKALAYRDGVIAAKQNAAQAFLLDLLSKKTQGAADATQGPLHKAISTFKDVVEDTQRALAIGFLPLLTRVADFLKTNLARPEVIDSLKKFGAAVAKLFDKGLDFAQKIPWGSIAAALKIAASAANAILDAFLKMPKWVQTAIITGAIAKIAIGFVPGLGGGGGGGGGITDHVVQGIATGLAGAVGKSLLVTIGGSEFGTALGAAIAAAAPFAALLALPAAIAGLGILITQQTDPTGERNTAGKAATATARGIPDWNNKALQELEAIKNGVNGGFSSLPGKIADDIVPLLPKTDAVATAILAAGAQRDAETSSSIQTLIAQDASIAQSVDVEDLNAKATAAIASLDQTTYTGTSATTQAARTAGMAAASAAYGAGAGVEQAIRANRPIINVDVQISATDITQVNVVEDRGGSRSGSRDGDGGGGPGQ